MKQSLTIVFALGLLTGGLGGYFAGSYKPKTDWKKSKNTFVIALEEVMTMQGFPKELAQTVSGCLADKVVAHLSTPGDKCNFLPPSNTVEALRVIDGCVGAQMSSYFRTCAQEADDKANVQP